MNEHLNVIALISGGKDSFFSILHCIQNGHRIVALANLYPSNPSDTNDLNSYMYQTVGHDIIPLYEDALGLPLYRRQISGTAINRDNDYELATTGPSVLDEDETESLLLLLEKVKSRHPEINAVCSGAIQSTYQRTRVESVALRLGLVPLSYLWQYPSLPVPYPSKGGLLRDIAAVGLDARIVKVASGGLDEEFLWSSLQEETLRKKLDKCVSRFGGSVLGEGGEYETLVMDGPSGIWKRRLEIREEDRRIVQVEGGESWAVIQTARIIEKDDQASDLAQWGERLATPNVWDEIFNKLLSDQDEAIIRGTGRLVQEFKRVRICSNWIPRQTLFISAIGTTINNLTAADAGLSAGEQMSAIKKKLLVLFKQCQISSQGIVSTTILLRSMDDFAAVNAVYGTMFTKPNPPARVTVACGDELPKGIKVVINCITDAGPRHARKGLHVQSRSYWAPANIGPYSQSIAVPLVKHYKERDEDEEAFMVHIAGQIPLIPASMQVYNLGPSPPHSHDDLATFWGQTCLSLQHLWRVSKYSGVTWWAYGIAFFVRDMNCEVNSQAMLTWLAWSKMHEPDLWKTGEGSDDEEDKADIWDRTYGGQVSFAREDEEMYLPDFRKRRSLEASLPAFFAVQVDQLPRACSVEWQSLGLAKPVVELIEDSLPEGVTWNHCYLPEHSRTISAISLPTRTTDEYILNLSAGRKVNSVTIYTTWGMEIGAQIIPCKSVWGANGRTLSAAVIMDYHGKPIA